MNTYLPTSNDSKVHRSPDLISPNRLEGFIIVANNGTEFLNIFRTQNYFGAGKYIMVIQVRKRLAIAVLELPVERLDTVVPSVSDFMDRSGSHRWFLLKLQGKRDRDLSALFKDSDVDQVGGRVIKDLNSFELGIIHAVRTSSTVGDN